MTDRYFIFGAGYSGQAIGLEALETGAEVHGTSRSDDKAEHLRSLGMKAHIFDGSEVTADIAEALHRTTHLVISIAPGDADPVLAVARTFIAQRMPPLRWIGYLSTVGVYGDHEGAWVDEDSELRPTAQRSQERLAAENEWLQLGKEIGVPVAVLRLSGIYGPGRNALASLANGTARRIIRKGQVFNRTHVDDIAGAALHLAAAGTGGVFNITDDEPSPPQDLIVHAARLMGVEPPAEEPFEGLELSPMARSFWGECKRVSNKRIKEQGYRLRYPDYRAALDQLWQSGHWRGR